MKYTKRLLAAVMAFAMVSAIAPMSAFADTEIKPDTVPPEGGLTVKYDVDPSYTVTIPAGVDITTGDKTASITLNEGALLAEGSKIEVVLEKGAYTTTGNAFTAKTESGKSSASYQINGGDVKVGDVVASLDKDTRSADLTFSRTETTKPTFAGTHSEVLTFKVSVKDSVESVLAPALENGAKINFAYNWNELNRNTYFEFTNNNGSYTLSSLTEEDAEHFNTTSLRVKADNPNVLILDVVCGEKYEWDDEFDRMDPFCSTIEFDTTDNTFKFTNRGATPTNPPRKCKLISVSVNGTDVTDQLTEKN